ncbi:hypothetical protein AgCh_000992 [Apium graveolens]
MSVIYSNPGFDIKNGIRALPSRIAEALPRFMENHNVNNAINTTVDPNAQVVVPDGDKQYTPNPNAQNILSDMDQMHIVHLPSGNVVMGHTIVE